MLVKYDLTEDDLIYLTRYQLSKHGHLIGRIAMGIGCSLVGLLGIVRLYYVVTRHAFLSGDLLTIAICTGFLCLGSTILISFTTWNLRHYVRRTFKNSKGVIGVHTLALFPDYFETTNAYSESKTQWSNIVSIVDEPRYILLLTTSGNLFMGHFIPKRSFPTPAQADLFYQTAMAFWKGEAPPEPPADNSAVWPPPPQTLGTSQ